ncbi:MAG TPA: hypothetical protein PK264_14215 [Hyphomicrobiaceae bacterium]|nr:hypothetical protein [Hyphomicrobiaceae bacterium]
MRSTHLIAALLAGLAVLAGGAGQALADAIDGDWCRDGASFRIRGPSIVTPGGNAITGDYDRHGFRYVVPPSERHAGSEINMSLMNDDLVVVRRRDGATKSDMEPETWRRCKVTS